jgi:hypothetical protein
MRYLFCATMAALFALLMITRDSPATSFAGGCSHTEIVEWAIASGGNGHYYQGVCTNGGATWDDAKNGAELLGGYLATLTSAQENDFVFDLIDDEALWYDTGDDWCPGPLIGALQSDGSEEPAGGWGWVSGEPFVYTNWDAGQPANDGFDENRAAFGTGGCVSLTTTNGWHDIADDDDHPSFVVEWDESPYACANTVIVEWPAAQGGNGHFYQGVCGSGTIEWDEARDAAEDMGGYLVTNTSQAENDFVTDLIDEPGFWNLASFACIVGPWIGGTQPPGADEPGGGWEWVTGEPFVYDNWVEGEPDDFDGDDAIVYWGGCPSDDRGFWADLVSSELGEVISYVVEWDQNPVTPTPTPGEERTWGDNNCSGPPPDPVDSLLALRFDAGLDTNTGDCPDMGQIVDVQNASPHPWGDVDCGGDVSPVDSLKLLRFDGGLPVDQEVGCPPMGEEVLISEGA